MSSPPQPQQPEKGVSTTPAPSDDHASSASVPSGTSEAPKGRRLSSTTTAGKTGAALSDKQRGKRPETQSRSRSTSQTPYYAIEGILVDSTLPLDVRVMAIYERYGVVKPHRQRELLKYAEERAYDESEDLHQQGMQLASEQDFDAMVIVHLVDLSSVYRKLKLSMSKVESTKIEAIWERLPS